MKTPSSRPMCERIITANCLPIRGIICYIAVLLSVGCQNASPNPEHLEVKLGCAANLWFAQPSIIIAEHWDEEVGLSLKQVKLPGPAHILQALVVGDLDGMTSNLGSLLLAKDKGIDVRTVSATFLGDIGLLASPSFAAQYGLSTDDGTTESSLVKFLRVFPTSHGRKVKLVANTRGSLSDLNIRLWLARALPDHDKFVEIINAGDQAQLMQVFLSGGADLIASFAQLDEIAETKLSGVKLVLAPDAVARPQAGGALVLRESFANEHPEVAAKLRTLFERATSLLKNDPGRAAQHLDKYLMEGNVPLPVLEQAIRNSKDYFTTDLEGMIPALGDIQQLMQKEDYIKNKFALRPLLLNESERKFE